MLLTLIWTIKYNNLYSHMRAYKYNRSWDIRLILRATLNLFYEDGSKSTFVWPLVFYNLSTNPENYHFITCIETHDVPAIWDSLGTVSIANIIPHICKSLVYFFIILSSVCFKANIPVTMGHVRKKWDTVSISPQWYNNI